MAETNIFKNIWLVDDDEDDHLFFESAIKTVSPITSVTHLYKCGDLLDLLQNGELPDLLFLDIQLPVMDGITCLKYLLQSGLTPGLKTIVYAGSDYPNDIQYCYQNGAVLYIIKPLTFRKLEKTLRRLFDLEWSEPTTITKRQRKGERLLPFKA